MACLMFGVAAGNIGVKVSEKNTIYQARHAALPYVMFAEAPF